MPPEQIETDITGRFERFFTLGAGIDHMESRSLPGVSIIKVFFQPGTSAGFRRERDLEPRHGRSAAPASGHAAADRAEVRRVKPARLSHHAQGRGAQRNPAARSRSVHRPQSTGERAGRVGAAALRRQVPPDHGVRRPGQAAGLRHEPDGRRRVGQQRESDSAVRRRQDRPVRLHDLHEQPVPRHRRHQPHSAQDVGRIDGDGCRRRTRRGREPDSEQRGRSGRPAVRVPAGDEAGRRHEHHRRRRRREGCRGQARGRAQPARRQRRLRPVALREARDRDAARRGQHRPAADGPDGARVPRELPGNRRRLPFDSAFGAGCAHRALRRRQLDQHDDPGRLCARLLASDRQRGHRSRKHLPPHGDGRIARGRRREGRRGSVDGRSCGDAHELDRVLSGHVSLRREPVSVFSAGARGRPRACSRRISSP